MNKKLYIFITNGIVELGGVELYLANKDIWLRENDWDVRIFSAAWKKDQFKVKDLEKYRNQVFPILAFAPYECIHSIYKEQLSGILEIIGDYTKYTEIIIESHSGSTALWGEIIAELIGATHIMAPMHEVFEEDCYVEKKDFFIFKLDRKEIFGGWIQFVRDVLSEDPNKVMPFRVQYSPIMDIDDNRLNKIELADYTICYFGRTAKPYYKSIIEGVIDFSKKHQDASVQFVVVGSIKDHQKISNLIDIKKENLKIILLGEMFPVPRKLFSMVDVVCAGAGSANAAVFENVLTIVPDLNSNLSNGVLGYDIISPLVDGNTVEQLSFCEIFEKTLIRKEYHNKKFLLDYPPSVNECCRETYMHIKNSDVVRCYYDHNLILKGKVSIKRKLQFLKNYFTHKKLYLR